MWNAAEGKGTCIAGRSWSWHRDIAWVPAEQSCNPCDWGAFSSWYAIADDETLLTPFPEGLAPWVAWLPDGCASSCWAQAEGWWWPGRWWRCLRPRCRSGIRPDWCTFPALWNAMIWTRECTGRCWRRKPARSNRQWGGSCRLSPCALLEPGGSLPSGTGRGKWNRWRVWSTWWSIWRRSGWAKEAGGGSELASHELCT